MNPLIHRVTHEIQPIYFDRVYSLPKSFFKNPKWTFDWYEIIESSEQEAYALRLTSDHSIQGLISLQMKTTDQYIEVNLVESAPWNIGRQTKVWIAVGQMLFGIACKLSFAYGFDGYVSFLSKTKIIQHYENTLNAKRFSGNSGRMIIDSLSAKELVRKFDYLTELEVLEWIRKQSIY